MSRMLPVRGLTVAQPARRVRPPSMWKPSTADALAVTASSIGTIATATAHVTPHTIGAWTDIVVSTSTEATEIAFAVTATLSSSGVDTSTLLDIGVDPAGGTTFTAVIANLTIGGAVQGLSFQVPVSVPKGSRVAVRVRSVVVSKTVSVIMRLRKLPRGLRPAAATYSFGETTAASRGTAVSYPGSANTKSSWQTIGSPTIERLGGLVVSAGPNGDTSMGTGGALLDIGYGTGTITIVEPDIYYEFTSTENIRTYFGAPLVPCDIPAGQQLNARMQGDAAANSAVDVVLTGIPWRP